MPDWHVGGMKDTQEQERAMNLRQTWLPNKYGVQACIWCDMPAARCVIEEPCEGRKQFEERSACTCNLPSGVHRDFHAADCATRT